MDEAHRGKDAVRAVRVCKDARHRIAPAVKGIKAILAAVVPLDPMRSARREIHALQSAAEFAEIETHIKAATAIE
jgi:hypothetical protein